jgi:hypothetical protein
MSDWLWVNWRVALFVIAEGSKFKVQGSVTAFVVHKFHSAPAVPTSSFVIAEGSKFKVQGSGYHIPHSYFLIRKLPG